MHTDVLLSDGNLPTRTVGEPGVQGVMVAGTQGIGVSTPIAAEVAAATAGLAKLMHIPKLGMFTMGLWSMMFAAGVGSLTMLTGRTDSGAGVTPKLQATVAPAITWRGMF
jgi:hypothetical protein